MSTPGFRPDLDRLSRSEMAARYASALDQVAAELQEAEAMRRLWNKRAADRGEKPVRQRLLPGMEAAGNE